MVSFRKPVDPPIFIGDSKMGGPPALAKRLSDLRNGAYHNSGDIIIVLRDRGNSGQNGYYWKREGVQYDVQKSIHGSLSRYEGRTVFVLFRPEPGDDTDTQAKVEAFLTRHYQPAFPGAEVRLTTGHADFFESLVRYPREIYMSEP